MKRIDAGEVVYDTPYHRKPRVKEKLVFLAAWNYHNGYYRTDFWLAPALFGTGREHVLFKPQHGNNPPEKAQWTSLNEECRLHLEVQDRIAHHMRLHRGAQTAKLIER